MVRHEKLTGHNHISWGYDDMLQGYFLTVTDERLSWQEGQTPEVDKVCERVSGDLGGHYLQLNSYPHLKGSVSEATIFTIMKRYHIDPKKIGTEDAGATIGVGSAKECANQDCRMPESLHKRCGKCKSVWYCSKSCQASNWITHKAVCKEP